MSMDSNISMQAPDHRRNREHASRATNDDVDALLAPRPVSSRDLAPESIDPNPFQARKYFDEDALRELADSIAESGMLVPIRVRPHPREEGRYQLLYGERRVRAARLARLASIPAEIGEYTDEELLEIGLVENVQRKDLSPLEEAHMFAQVLEQKYSIRKLAAKIGKDKSYIEDRLALLRLPGDLLQIVEDVPKVSMRSVNEIAKLPTPALRAALIRQLRLGLVSTEDVRLEVKRLLISLESSQPVRSAAPSDEGAIVFQRNGNKMSSRIDSTLREYQKVKKLYEGAPAAWKKELLLEWVKPLEHILKEIQELGDE